MVIKIGENPQGVKGINKFIAKSGDGMRGKIIAMKDSNKEAIILAENESCKKDVVWGNLYLIRELEEGHYPTVISRVTKIPNIKKWRVV